MRLPYACAEDELTQAGLLCTEEDPCPIFLEFSTVTLVGRKIFVAGDLHATSGTLASVLLATDDNGATWKESAARITGAALEELQFHDLEHGWAAGETQYPLPRDPFFLVTSDGGLSWRNRPVTEDGGPGSILRFWFDTARHGELVVDAGRRSEAGRYHSYESETGGESWMIRGITAQVPKLKYALPSEADVRFRATGKSWVIEKRSSEKWEPVASFLVEAANCKIKPPEVKEPLPQ